MFNRSLPILTGISTSATWHLLTWHLFAYGFGRYAPFEATTCECIASSTGTIADSYRAWVAPIHDNIIGTIFQVALSLETLQFELISPGRLNRPSIPPQPEDYIHPHHCRSSPVSLRVRILRKHLRARLTSLAVVSFTRLQSESQAGVRPLR